MDSKKSSFSLSDFKASIKSNGILRPTRFEVVLFPPTELLKSMDTKEISIRCHTAQMPPFHVKTVDYTVGQGQLRKMPKGYEQGHHIDFTFYNNISASVYNGLLAWSKYSMASKEENNYSINYFDNFIGTVEIRQLDERDNIRYGFSLREAYPISIDVIDLDSGHVDTPQLVKVTIAYRYARTLEEVKLDSASNSTFSKLNIVSAVIDDTNKYGARGKISTSTGMFKTRTTNYDSSEYIDPTIKPVVLRKKGAGLPYATLYANATSAIFVANRKGRGVYVNHYQFVDYATTTMNGAFSTGNILTINSSWSDVKDRSTNLTADTNSFFSDTVSCINQYNEIKPLIPENDPIIGSMNELMTTYSDVSDAQINTNITMDDLQNKVDEYNSTSTLTIV